MTVYLPVRWAALEWERSQHLFDVCTTALGVADHSPGSHPTFPLWRDARLPLATLTTNADRRAPRTGRAAVGSQETS